MKPRALCSLLLAGLFLVGTAATALAQADDQDHDAHHPQETQTTPQPAVSDEAPAPGMPSGMPGMMGGMPEMMGMMSPEMMQMMQMMQGMMARQGGEVGEQEMMGPGMHGGHHHGRHHHGGHHHGMMGGPGLGPGLLYGMPHGTGPEMTPEKVRAFLEQRLAWHGNPRLRIGEIATAADGSITAEIVTLDGSLVQKLAFNRYPGLFRQLEE